MGEDDYTLLRTAAQRKPVLIAIEVARTVVTENATKKRGQATNGAEFLRQETGHPFVISGLAYRTPLAIDPGIFKHIHFLQGLGQTYDTELMHDAIRHARGHPTLQSDAVNDILVALQNSHPLTKEERWQSLDRKISEIADARTATHRKQKTVINGALLEFYLAETYRQKLEEQQESYDVFVRTPYNGGDVDIIIASEGPAFTRAQDDIGTLIRLEHNKRDWKGIATAKGHHARQTREALRNGRNPNALYPSDVRQIAR